MKKVPYLLAGMVVGVTTFAFAAASRHQGSDEDHLGGISAILAILIGILSFAGLMTLFAAVAPQLVRRCAVQVVQRRRTAFWLGLVATGVFLVFLAGTLSFAAAGAGVFVLVAILVSVGFALIYVVGYSGVAYHVGTQILARENANEAAATGVGTLTIGFASLVPVIGWVIGFYVFCLSIGMFPFAWFGSEALPQRDVVVEPERSRDLPR